MKNLNTLHIIKVNLLKKIFYEFKMTLIHHLNFIRDNWALKTRGKFCIMTEGSNIFQELEN